MKRLVFINVLVFIFCAFYASNLKAEENFCIRESGFLKPLLNSKECKKKEIQINKSEFRAIKDVEPKLRSKALLEFRKKEIARKEIETKKKEEASLKKLNLVRLEEKYKDKCEKNLLGGYEKGTIEYNQCLIFAEEAEKLEIEKRKEQIALIEKRRIEWEQKLKKREEERKKEIISRKAQVNNILKKREEFNKKIAEARKENANSISNSYKKEVVTDKKNNSKSGGLLFKNKQKDDVVKKQIEVPKDGAFKVFYYNKKIVNHDKLFNILSKNTEINFLEQLSKNDIEDLLGKYSNFVLSIPVEFLVFSNTETTNKMTSQYVAGVQQVPNPEFASLQMKIRNAQSQSMVAMQRSYYHQRLAQNPSSYSWLGVLEQAANLAAQIKYQNLASEQKNLYTSLTSEMSSTPIYIDKDILQPYSYNVKKINSEKKGIFKIIESKNNVITEKYLEIVENKKFEVANNIQVSDKNYENLIRKFNSLDDINLWENKPLRHVSFDKLVSKYNNIDAEKNKILDNKDQLYASLDFEIPKVKKEKSFFSKLFDFGSDNDQEKNNEQKGDSRFKSVVIVKTNKGLGSGFYVEKNKIVTNYHVIENSTKVTVENHDGKIGSAKILKTDKMRDLALLEVNLKGKPVKLSEEALYSGMQVAALGHPSGLSFSMTQGIISSIRKHSTTYDVTGNSNILFVQTDAAINKGNSGGPLFHKNSVIGVNTQGLSKSKTEGLNFAVHVAELKKFLDN